MGVAGKASRCSGWSGGDLRWEWAGLACPERELGGKERNFQQIILPAPAACVAVLGRCMTDKGPAYAMQCIAKQA